MSSKIRTTGYQGESIDVFIRKLKNRDVEVLIDVRELPLSRKPGFSKKALKERLDAQGIDYLHVPELGMPKSLRSQRHNLPDNAPILDEYSALLPYRHNVIEQLLEELNGRKGCMMCFEADESQCHRSRLGAYIAHHFSAVDVKPLLEPALMS